MHSATNATINSNTREQSSHNAQHEKRNQQQQHSGLAATTHRATNATNQQHPGTKQLQCMTEQCNQNSNAREQGRGTMQDTTNATKNSTKTREEVATMHDATKATKNTYQEVQTSALSLDHWRPTWLVRETD